LLEKAAAKASAISSGGAPTSCGAGDRQIPAFSKNEVPSSFDSRALRGNTSRPTGGDPGVSSKGRFPPENLASLEKAGRVQSACRARVHRMPRPGTIFSETFDGAEQGASFSLNMPVSRPRTFCQRIVRVRPTASSPAYYEAQKKDEFSATRVRGEGFDYVEFTPQRPWPSPSEVSEADNRGRAYAANQGKKVTGPAPDRSGAPISWFCCPRTAPQESSGRRHGQLQGDRRQAARRRGIRPLWRDGRGQNKKKRAC